MRTRAAIYCRVSDPDQAKKELSIPAQQSALREYAEKNNMEIVAEYIDEGESAYKKRGERTQFKTMIADAKQKPRPFDVILVHKWDRFARNREDSIVHKSIIRKQCGIELISITEPIGDGPIGKLLEGILEVLAEFYSDNLAVEVKKGMTEASRHAKALGKPPIGYTIQDGKFVPHPKEASVIKFIFERYVSGIPTSQIRDQIYERADEFGEWVLEKKWTVIDIAHILSKPIYKGQYKWGDTIIDNAVEPLVSEELFDMAQRIKKNRIQVRSNTHDYLLRGILRCAGCGRLMVLVTSRNDLRLRCSRHANYGDCFSNSVKLDKITQRAIDEIKRFMSTLDSSGVQIEFREDQVIKAKREETLKELSAIDMRFKRLLIAYENGVLDLGELKAAKAEVERRKADLQKSLSQLDNVLTQDISQKAQVIQDKLQRSLEVIENKTIPLPDRKRALSNIVKEILWSRRDDSLRIFYTI